jgi:hypothetical protein
LKKAVQEGLDSGIAKSFDPKNIWRLSKREGKMAVVHFSKMDLKSMEFE